MKEIHQLYQGFLRLILTGYVRKGNTGFFLHVHLGSALSHAAHALHHEIHHDNNQDKRKDKADQRLDHGHAVLAFPADLYAARKQTVCQLVIPLHRNGISF